ncbi:MAG: hypothetical protein CMB11_07805 [Euryarchaeota archaeon]|nr:hypothetical protein [Euryarchaeota archaeon]|tara:strand:- start:4000 stop:6096 length:2097 start_codon:yes stop_codon:yes gene_type:complete
MGRRYDTLDNVDTEGVSDIGDLYALVVSEAMGADDLCGVVTSGPLNQPCSHSGYWGERPQTFQGHTEAWYVRSAPAGRIGKPLEHGEVRQISVLVRESETSKQSTVTNIKLWRRPETHRLYAKEVDVRQRDRGWATMGPIGVASRAIHIFEQRPNGAAKAVLPAVAITTRWQKAYMQRCVEPLLMPSYVLASSMIGVPIPNAPMPPLCEISYGEVEWSRVCAQSACLFKRACSKQLNAMNGADTENQLLVSAEDVSEQESFIGYLDQRADSFYDGAMQDDMHKPSGMPLIVAVAVCFACTADRWGLPKLRGDDAFATREARHFVQSALPPIATLDQATDGTPGSEHFDSIDVIVNYALANIHLCLRKMQEGMATPAHAGVVADGKNGHGVVDTDKIETALKASMHYLMCTGISVCVDLFGLPPKRSSGQDGAYTEYGFATHVVDPVMLSRVQSAHDKGLGYTVPRWDTLRTSTRGKRQLALASVVVEVDEWLRTGKYKGVVLHPTAQASASVRPDELSPSTPVAPASTSARSTKKKPKKQQQQAPEELLAERGKRRGERQRCYATDAVRCMLKAGPHSDMVASMAAVKLCGEAVQAAAGIVSDAMQGLGQGVCVGIGDLFDIRTHLVGPASKVQCAHCENTVDVVESVAFSGALGTCPDCQHPRCLECVAAHIAAHGVGGIVKCTECAYCQAANDSYY